MERMDLKSLGSLNFTQDLYLDRRLGKYCFQRGPDRVLVTAAGQSITLDELHLLFHPYVPVTILRDEEMFEPAVLDHLRRLLAGAASSSPPAARAPVPVTAPASPPVPVPAPAAPPVSPAAAAPRPPPPPAMKVAALREELREQVFDKLGSAEGQAALISGKLDDEIRGLVSAICKEVKPRQIIAGHTSGEEKSDADFFMDATMTSQAFGLQLDLGQTDLFLLAKSAILQTLNEADRKNIQVIKQSLLLGKSSPAFSKRLSHYYQEITRYLKANKVTSSISELILKSRYVYLEEWAEELPDPAMALGIADAFVTLQEAGKLTLEILQIVPERLHRLLGSEAEKAQKAIEGLIRESCYNEFHRAFDARLTGGDYCDFFPIARGKFGIVIFDVSGHEERASALREVLAKAFQKIPDRTDPAKVVGILNRFVEQVPFPEDVFVSMVYGVLDLNEGRFIYSNAGHHSPYLVRNNVLNRLEEAGGLALNMGDDQYENGAVPLAPMDCLVLYTDGLTEAVNPRALAGRKELFGHGRLESVITGQKLGTLKAKRAVESILAAVRDQGFQIEDDITVQVYRHI